MRFQLPKGAHYRTRVRADQGSEGGDHEQNHYWPDGNLLPG